MFQARSPEHCVYMCGGDGQAFHSFGINCHTYSHLWVAPQE